MVGFRNVGLWIDADVLGCRRRIMCRLCSSRGSRDGILEGLGVGRGREGKDAEVWESTCCQVWHEHA